MATLTKTFGNSLKMIIEKYEIKQSDLAKECGITKGTLSKILNSGRESSFNIVLKLIGKMNESAPSSPQDELVLCYIREIGNSSNIKMAMEYCDTRDMRPVLEMLCERADSKANRMNDLREYSLTYRANAQQKYQDPNDDRSRDLIRVLSRKNKSVEMQIFQSIIKLFMLQKEMNYHKIIESVPRIEDQLKKSDSSIHSSLEMRLNQLMQTVYLRNACDFKKSRELANKALENSIGKRFDAASYVNIGDSFIHEDPEEAISYIEKSIIIYKEIGLDILVNWMTEKIEFISVLTRKKIEFLQEDQSIALKYILNGQKDAGLEILNRLDTTPMRSYIRGIATDDPADFWKSLEGYMKRGDRLYGLFPVLELKRLGEREDTIEMLYNNTLREVINP